MYGERSTVLCPDVDIQSTRVRPKVETLTKSAQSWDSGIFYVGLAHSRVHKIQQKIL